VDEQAYLVIGCHGRVDDGFILCSSTENRILRLDDSLDGIKSILEYFENIRLFDRPVMDINAIRHIIFNLQEKYPQGTKKIWTESEFRSLEKYILMHKMCGIYARLILGFEEDDESEDVKIPIKGLPEIQNHRKPKLKLVRGKR